ncbi:MAG: cobalamin B12-binding domain-containing protein [Planctomycetes bacterium]|nr:cobalamin-dependent protein [Planctomycetota bacterium]MCB9903802.1 cobalamin B12-binding domain-containing protein [Planctomycetota bacterium]
MNVFLLYAKAQNLKAQAAEIFADETANKGELARDEVYPPLGISILAAWLEQKGHDVRLMDDSIEEIEDIKKNVEWAEVVGISSLTPNARRARELGQMIRREFGKPVVMGGPHPTTNPEFFLESGACDVTVQGEGDYTLPELLEVIHEPAKWETVEGITYLKDGELYSTPRRPLLKDVDEVPFPAYHLWDIPRYMKLMINPGVTLITSRGCPYACTFCDAEMTPRQYRAMNPERTVDLIEHILRTYNPPQLVLFDDLFTIQRKRVIEICKEIIKRDLFFEWVCESRVDTMDFEMLRWLRKAGCVKIYYGLESGSPRMLVTMKKGVTPEKVLHGAKLNRQLGMYFKFFILYGFPEDTVEDHRLTEELIAETRPDAVCCAILQPIPGTAVYEQLKPYLTKDVAEMDFHYWHSTESFKHPTFTHQELHKERDRLLVAHAKATKGLIPRLRRKLERLVTMIRHPYLFMDLLEIRTRRKRYLKRVAESDWAWTQTQRRDQLALQVPTVSVD